MNNSQPPVEEVNLKVILLSTLGLFIIISILFGLLSGSWSMWESLSFFLFLTYPILLGPIVTVSFILTLVAFFFKKKWFKVAGIIFLISSALLIASVATFGSIVGQ